MTLASIISIPGINDPVSCATHMAGAIAALIAGIGLIRTSRPGIATTLSLSVYVTATVFLLAASGAFHLLPDGRGRDALQQVDHAAIFTMIAATFTPIHAILFKGFRRWGMLAFIWAVAIVGVTIKMVYFDEIPYWIGLVFYLAMGWMGAVSMVMISRLYGIRFTRHLVWGAAAYTGGAIIELINRPVFIPGVIEAHEIFHVAVLLGISEHWLFIRQCAHRETVGWTVR